MTHRYTFSMVLEFAGEAIWWRGPAPFVFVRVPEAEAGDIKAVSNRVTYGWGCIPATVGIGRTSYTTSLFPKDGGYLVPIKTVVQKAESLKVGDIVAIRLEIAIG